MFVTLNHYMQDVHVLKLKTKLFNLQQSAGGDDLISIRYQKEEEEEAGFPLFLCIGIGAVF